jgi:hypothetical protein
VALKGGRNVFKVAIDAYISKLVDEVFAYLADVTKQPEWEPSILACRLELKP